MRRNGKPLTRAERVIREISELRELGRRLASAGHQAGLHKIPWTVLPPLPDGRRRRGTRSLG